MSEVYAFYLPKFGEFFFVFLLFLLCTYSSSGSSMPHTSMPSQTLSMFLAKRSLPEPSPNPLPTLLALTLSTDCFIYICLCFIEINVFSFLFLKWEPCLATLLVIASIILFENGYKQNTQLSLLLKAPAFCLLMWGRGFRSRNETFSAATEKGKRTRTCLSTGSSTSLCSAV